jgi:hypothetical protein
VLALKKSETVGPVKGLPRSREMQGFRAARMIDRHCSRSKFFATVSASDQHCDGDFMYGVFSLRFHAVQQDRPATDKQVEDSVLTLTLEKSHEARPRKTAIG